MLTILSSTEQVQAIDTSIAKFWREHPALLWYPPANSIKRSNNLKSQLETNLNDLNGSPAGSVRRDLHARFQGSIKENTFNFFERNRTENFNYYFIRILFTFYSYLF